ncbi:MAG: SIS domain-containing protein, partial [Candidatus Marinimicrobia bacterium]|nr:SIS domain-containing protein [Candidatus Neomarinimicrobiota bacterium]
ALIISKFKRQKSAVITITQSGETADLLEAIKSARERHTKIISLVNVRGSSAERESDITIPVNAGPEIAVASTKASSAQLKALVEKGIFEIYKKLNVLEVYPFKTLRHPLNV